MRLVVILLALASPACHSGHGTSHLPAGLAMPTPCDHEEHDLHESGRECGQVRHGCDGEPEDFRPCSSRPADFSLPSTTFPGIPEPPVGKPMPGGS